MWFREKRRRLNLALQGGDAHGAFTWGVLDRLLKDEDLEVGWLSGTSAGAVNAVAAAHGLAQASPEAACAALEAIWSDVIKAGVPDLLRLNPFLFGLATAAPVTNILSPYGFNPLGFDPLREILEKHIDFDAIRTSDSVQVIIAATDVSTGRARLFRNSELTIDVVLASACLPTLHHAVIIDGRAYWDGGFSANPDLVTLARESTARDTLLVQLNPLLASAVPRTPAEIEDRVNTITFNQPLLRDIEFIVKAREASTGWFGVRASTAAVLKRHRFHLIEAQSHTAHLGAQSKVMPDKTVLRALYAAGAGEANDWLRDNRSSLGRRETVDLQRHFLFPRVDATVPVDGEDGAAAVAISA